MKENIQGRIWDIKEHEWDFTMCEICGLSVLHGEVYIAIPEDSPDETIIGHEECIGQAAFDAGVYETDETPQLCISKHNALYCNRSADWSAFYSTQDAITGNT